MPEYILASETTMSAAEANVNVIEKSGHDSVPVNLELHANTIKIKKHAKETYVPIKGITYIGENQPCKLICGLTGAFVGLLAGATIGGTVSQSTNNKLAGGGVGLTSGVGVGLGTNYLCNMFCSKETLNFGVPGNAWNFHLDPNEPEQAAKEFVTKVADKF